MKKEKFIEKWKKDLDSFLVKVEKQNRGGRRDLKSVFCNVDGAVLIVIEGCSMRKYTDSAVLAPVSDSQYNDRLGHLWNSITEAYVNGFIIPAEEVVSGIYDEKKVVRVKAGDFTAYYNKRYFNGIPAEATYYIMSDKNTKCRMIYAVMYDEVIAVILPINGVNAERFSIPEKVDRPKKKDQLTKKGAFFITKKENGLPVAERKEGYVFHGKFFDFGIDKRQFGKRAFWALTEVSTGLSVNITYFNTRQAAVDFILDSEEKIYQAFKKSEEAGYYDEYKKIIAEAR